MPDRPRPADDANGPALGGDDPFGTADLRGRVLRAWSVAPERFREDANAEEDLALGGYRDRLVVELAQNASDAAVSAGVPGRLLLRLADGVLVAANTGARLGADGVLALSTLRASSKRDGRGTGRFGVGFAAVLAVSEAPAVVGHGMGVRFSREESLAAVRDAAAGHPALRSELERRHEHVPVLRLPWPATGTAPQWYDTAVLLPLRDGAATDLAATLLREVGDPLLLSLPGLCEVVVELPGEPPRRVGDVGSRWRTTTRTGAHPAAALADRPTEERARPGWSLTWAVPRDPAVAVPRVLHAPTPTDEPMAWPALLVADLPLDPSRRHVAPGAATDSLVAEAASAYADLLVEIVSGGADVVPLVPVGLPAGAVDAALREATWARLHAAAVLRRVEDGRPVEPRDAVALAGAAADDAGALAVLAPMLSGLVAAPRSADQALRLLGVRRLELAEVVDAMPAGQEPATWSARYAGLAGAAVDAAAREALSALPVPLADGRVVRGVRGLLLPSPSLGPVADALAVLAGHGVRVVHPDALASPGSADLLERLGAVPATATAVLDNPAVRSAVRWTADDPDPGEVSDAVLAVVRAAWQESPWAPGERGWLADLALPDADGDPTPAGLLVQPGSAVAAVLDPESVGLLDTEVAARWPAAVLQAVGVAGAPVLVRCAEVDPDDLPAELDELDGAAQWATAVGTPAGSGEAVLVEVLAVRDLDLVLTGSWPVMVALLAADPDLRRAVTEPVVLTDGRVAVRVPSYTAWWLRQHLGLAGSVVREGAGLPLWAELLPEAPPWVAGLDAGMRAALGVVGSADDLTGSDWLRLLSRLGETGPPTAALLLHVWDRVARAAEELLDAAGSDAAPPEPLWALGADLDPVVAARGAALVVDDPRWLQRRDLGPLVVAPTGFGAALADLLDLDLTSEAAPGRVSTGGQPTPVPRPVLSVLDGGPAQWVEHDDLRVDGARVDWWVDWRVDDPGATPVVHAATADGLARALACATGRWGDRHLIEAVLLGAVDPGTALVEGALG